MEIVEIKPGLYQSSAFIDQDFSQLKKLGIGVVIDLEGGFDPQFSGLSSYLYWGKGGDKIITFLTAGFYRDTITMLEFGGRCNG